MGQKFVPELHDPNYRVPERQDEPTMTEEEVDRRFDALIAKLDEEQRPHPHRH